MEVTTTEGEAPVGLFIFPPTQGGVVEFGGLALGRFDAVPRDTCELHGEESASIVLEGCGVLLYFHWEVPLSAQTGSIIDLVDVRVRERITETENSMEQADLGFYLTSAHVYNGQLSIRFATNRPSDTSAPKLTFELRSVLATVDGALVEMLTPEQAASDPASVDLVQNN